LNKTSPVLLHVGGKDCRAHELDRAIEIADLDCPLEAVQRHLDGKQVKPSFFGKLLGD